MVAPRSGTFGKLTASAPPPLAMTWRAEVKAAVSVRLWGLGLEEPQRRDVAELPWLVPQTLPMPCLTTLSLCELLCATQWAPRGTPQPRQLFVGRLREVARRDREASSGRGRHPAGHSSFVIGRHMQANSAKSQRDMMCAR